MINGTNALCENASNYNDFKQIQKKKMIKMAHITYTSVHQVIRTSSKYKKRK